jgi:hypothetical protein
MYNQMMLNEVIVKQGAEAVKEIYEELHQTSWYYSMYSTDSVVGYWGSYSEELGKKVADAGVLVKELISGKNRPVSYAKYFDSSRQEIKYLPHDTHIETDLILYEDKLVLISYESDAKAVIITEKGIVKMAKKMFELLWEGTPSFIDVDQLLSKPLN